MTTSDAPPRSPIRQAAALGAIGLAAAFVVWLATGGAPGAPSAPVGDLAYTLPLKAGVPADAEIAFYKKRVAKRPDGFLDQNALAAGYLRKARETGDPAWRLLAKRAADASLRAMPRQNPDAELVHAHLAIADHRFDAARAIVAGLARRHPATPTAGLLATLDLAQGRPAAAEKRLDAIVRGAPGAAAFAQLGLARAARGDDPGAETAFREAIAREQPGERLVSADARTWLARLWLRRGRLEEAATLLAEATKIWPRHAQAMGLAADVEARRGRLDAADAGWREVEASWHDAGPTVVRARIARAAGRPADAEARWAEAEARLRRDVAAGVVDHRRELVRLLLDRGRPAELAEAERLAAAERAMRQDAETLDLHAGALLAIGKAEEAAAAMAALDATGAREAPYLYRAAAIAKARGDAGAAARLIGEADALDPTFRRDPAFAPFEALAR